MAPKVRVPSAAAMNRRAIAAAKKEIHARLDMEVTPRSTGDARSPSPGWSSPGSPGGSFSRSPGSAGADASLAIDLLSRELGDVEDAWYELSVSASTFDTSASSVLEEGVDLAVAHAEAMRLAEHYRMRAERAEATLRAASDNEAANPELDAAKAWAADLEEQLKEQQAATDDERRRGQTALAEQRADYEGRLRARGEDVAAAETHGREELAKARSQAELELYRATSTSETKLSESEAQWREERDQLLGEHMEHIQRLHRERDKMEVEVLAAREAHDAAMSELRTSNAAELGELTALLHEQLKQRKGTLGSGKDAAASSKVLVRQGAMQGAALTVGAALAVEFAASKSDGAKGDPVATAKVKLESWEIANLGRHMIELTHDLHERLETLDEVTDGMRALGSGGSTSSFIPGLATSTATSTATGPSAASGAQLPSNSPHEPPQHEEKQRLQKKGSKKKNSSRPHSVPIRSPVGQRSSSGETSKEPMMMHGPSATEVGVEYVVGGLEHTQLKRLRSHVRTTLEMLVRARDLLYAQCFETTNVLGYHYVRNYPMKAAPDSWSKQLRRSTEVQASTPTAEIGVQCSLLLAEEAAVTQPITAEAHVQCSLPWMSHMTLTPALPPSPVDYELLEERSRAAQLVPPERSSNPELRRMSGFGSGLLLADARELGLVGSGAAAASAGSGVMSGAGGRERRASNASMERAGTRLAATTAIVNEGQRRAARSTSPTNGRVVSRGASRTTSTSPNERRASPSNKK